MAEMKDLIAAINRPNVGFVLDSWHWYTAGEGEAEQGLNDSLAVPISFHSKTLGVMIASGRQFLLIGWWMTALPGFALLVVGIALSLIGDGLAEKR